MLEFKDVSKEYSNGVKGLDNINIQIEDGEFVSIIGLSGAGKSTFLRSINRLINITKGEIVIGDKSITNASKKELRMLRRDIGMIAQSFNLVKRSTVQKNVLSGRLGYYSTWKSILGLFSQEDYELCLEALERVELSDKLHSRCDELSGGQQQRVSIARTLVQQAKIILADEPVAYLDPITSQRVMSDLKNINTTLGKTVLVNIHSVELQNNFPLEYWVLKKGKLFLMGVQMN